MNKWIEVYMQEHDLKPNEHFKIISEQDNHEYYFSENGQLCRFSNTEYNYVNYKLWGKVMSGDDIEKVKPKGRYIPKKGELYFFVGMYGGIIANVYDSEQDEYVIKHNLVFRTKEEAEDYKWFLDKVNEYKRTFEKDVYNHCFYFDVEHKRLDIDYCEVLKYDLTYFGSEKNIKEFISVVGDERIKKYFFNQY